MITGGYFQNEAFFAKERDYVKQLFQFVHSLPPELKLLENKIKNQNSVSIHIRRGDYLQNSQRYPLMSLNYYKKAVDYIQDKTKDPIHLFVFSDDIPWVKKNFKSKYPFTIMEGNSAANDMYLMTLCHHNVIANSTFSWWGAYLNKNPNKIIIAPDKWDNVDKWWRDEIILKEWVILPAD